jgi:hypothetical protein
MTVSGSGLALTASASIAGDCSLDACTLSDPDSLTVVHAIRTLRISLPVTRIKS